MHVDLQILFPNLYNVNFYIASVIDYTASAWSSLN